MPTKIWNLPPGAALTGTERFPVDTSAGGTSADTPHQTTAQMRDFVVAAIDARTGTATLSFGAAPGSSYATVVVSGQTGLTSTGDVRAWLQGDATATHNAVEHLIAPLTVRAGDVGVGTFTIHATTDQRLTGTFTVHWAWSI